MKLYVIHTCDFNRFRLPLECACYALSRQNASFMYCDNIQKVDSIQEHETAYSVPFSTGAGKSVLHVTRLKNSDSEMINNRE